MNDLTDYLQCTICCDNASEPLIAALCDFNTLGVLEKDGCITAYFAADMKNPAELKERIMALEGIREVMIQSCPGKNWVKCYQDTLKPVTCGSFFINPHPDRFQDPSDLLPIHIIPGLAFGTGEHPTTRLMLSMMSLMDLSDRRVLDVGCGSGILSIAAVKSGALSVVSIDNDFLAVIETRKNAVLNGVNLNMEVGEIASIHDSFDLVLVNILPNPLKEILTYLSCRIETEFDVLISGVESDDSDFINFLTRCSAYSVRKSHRLKGWSAWHLTTCPSST